MENSKHIENSLNHGEFIKQWRIHKQVDRSIANIHHGATVDADMHMFERLDYEKHGMLWGGGLHCLQLRPPKPLHVFVIKVLIICMFLLQSRLPPNHSGVW